MGRRLSHQFGSVVSSLWVRVAEWLQRTRQATPASDGCKVTGSLSHWERAGVRASEIACPLKQTPGLLLVLVHLIRSTALNRPAIVPVASPGVDVNRSAVPQIASSRRIY